MKKMKDKLKQKNDNKKMSSKVSLQSQAGAIGRWKDSEREIDENEQGFSDGVLDESDELY